MAQERDKWGHRLVTIICKKCHETFQARTDSKMKYCSAACCTRDRDYKRTIIDRGYKLIRKPIEETETGKPYRYEHRMIMEKQIGRELHRWEVVHHIDCNPSNNDISNLKVMSHSEHSRLHNLKEV
jgi:hypothetical protein